jgi:hypothetical protein
VNEVPFRARPHHNVHRTLGVDVGATGPLWRVDSIEKEGGIGIREERRKVTVTGNNSNHDRHSGLRSIGSFGFYLMYDGGFCGF